MSMDYESPGDVTEALVASQSALSATGQLELRTSSAAIAAQEVASIQARYVMAMKRPRDMELVTASLMLECKDRKFASVARFRKPMGDDKEIVGLSIRFAEAAIREMGNILVQDMVIHDDAERRIVKVKLTDLERNTYFDHDIAINKTVERKFVKEGQRVISSRVNSRGKTVHLVEATEDELIVKASREISKAIRTLTMRILPQWLKTQAEMAIVATLKGEAVEKPDDTRERILAAFAERGVTAAELQNYLGHGLDVLSPDEMVELRAVYQTLADEEATWPEILAAKMPTVGAPIPVEGGTTSAKADELKQRIKARRDAQQ